ncbi:MAG: hypothetical protein QM762_18400 [Chryseolinea sp.]
MNTFMQNTLDASIEREETISKQRIAGAALCFAGIAFWLSWFLMPDPGTTDAGHILSIVKQNRYDVFSSVIVQITSSIAYVVALTSIAQLFLPQRRITFWGLVLLGIGILGLCSDAFFHLLAFFMTDNTVTIQQDVVTVMAFMQTEGVVFLLPVLLPFFAGSIMLAIGLKKQGIISRVPQLLLSFALTLGPLCVVAAKTLLGYQGNFFSLALLALVALSHVIIGYKLYQFKST